jgi:hypothetical protein
MKARTHKQHSAAETVPEYLARIGRAGGLARTEAKRTASSANLKAARAKRWQKKETAK